MSTKTRPTDALAAHGKNGTKVAVGVIGAGGISRYQHVPNLLQSEHARLEVVCDLDRRRLEGLQQCFSGFRTVISHREVLGDPAIDAVLVATGPDSHVPLTVEALHAGKHVYVEKPLAENESDCQQVVAAQREAKRHMVVGFNRRMAPAYRRAKQLINEHGGAYNIHYRISDAYWIWGRDIPPGQRITHEVCHIFDLLRYLTSSEVTSVYCVNSRPDDDVITLQFDNGCVASIMSSGYVHYDMPKESLEVITKRGAFTITDFTELRTFGLVGEDDIERFAGHSHPNRDQAHRYLFKTLGLDALLATRKAFYRATTRLHQLPEDSTERAELEQYLDHHAPSVNYMVDKGWRSSIDQFALSILNDTPGVLSGAEDGLKAAQITKAAIRSRQRGFAEAL